MSVEIGWWWYQKEVFKRMWPFLLIAALGWAACSLMSDRPYLSRHERRRIAAQNAVREVTWIAGPVQRPEKPGARYLPLWIVRDTRGNLLVTDIPAAIGDRREIPSERLGIPQYEWDGVRR